MSGRVATLTSRSDNQHGHHDALGERAEEAEVLYICWHLWPLPEDDGSGGPELPPIVQDSYFHRDDLQIEQ